METKIYVELLSFSYLPISSAFVHCFSLFNRKGKMVRQPENINACLSSSKRRAQASLQISSVTLS